MKNKQIAFLFSDNHDLLELSRGIKNSTNIDLNINYIKLIKEILENNKKNNYIVAEKSIKAELYAIFSKLLNPKLEYSIWIDEINNTSLNEKLLDMITFYFSKSLITRTKQMRFLLNQQYKKKIFVIYPWIKEKKYEKKEFLYKIFSNTGLTVPDNWNLVNSLKNSDISVIRLKNKELLFKLPNIIIKSIEERIPTIIIYHKPKTVNKIFKYVKNIYVIKSIDDLDFNNLEYIAHQSYKFKIPKKFRFNYNLANLKKILK